ncbi:MAG: YHS domain-containing protein [Chloroflexi bacterium]|nr:YHS domain-containing protein [Chloroflexota bacterium]|tara:strand:- start:11060 stop:11263 length:204 start_codon:yes stop_codon:yes gene_type:complete
MKIPFLSVGKSETTVDPVCDMDVDTGNPPGGASTHKGTIYYFCGPGCRVAFKKDPLGYLSGEKSIEM